MSEIKVFQTCEHKSLYPLIHSSFDGKDGSWTHCNDCQEPVEITQEMSGRWMEHYLKSMSTTTVCEPCADHYHELCNRDYCACAKGGHSVV